MSRLKRAKKNAWRIQHKVIIGFLDGSGWEVSGSEYSIQVCWHYTYLGKFLHTQIDGPWVPTCEVSGVWSGFSITCVHYEANGWCIGTCGTSKKTQKGRKAVLWRKENSMKEVMHTLAGISWGFLAVQSFALLIIIDNRIPTCVQPQAPGLSL